jgi:hypothetical protein
MVEAAAGAGANRVGAGAGKRGVVSYQEDANEAAAMKAAAAAGKVAAEEAEAEPFDRKRYRPPGWNSGKGAKGQMETKAQKGQSGEKNKKGLESKIQKGYNKLFPPTGTPSSTAKISPKHMQSGYDSQMSGMTSQTFGESGPTYPESEEDIDEENKMRRRNVKQEDGEVDKEGQEEGQGDDNGGDDNGGDSDSDSDSDSSTPSTPSRYE